MSVVSKQKRIQNRYSVVYAFDRRDYESGLNDDDFELFAGGGTGGGHPNRENYCIWPEAEGLWTVRCCGEIIFGPATKAAVDTYYNSIQFG